MGITRTRSQSSMTSSPTTVLKVLQNGTTMSDYTVAGQWSGSSRVMTDVVTPYFSRQRNSGVLVNNPMSTLAIQATPSKLHTSRWEWTKSPPWPPTEVVGFLAPDPIGLRFGRLAFPENKLPPWDEAKAGIALAAARNQAAAPESQLLVTLGEARETFALIDSAIKLLTRRTEPFRVLRRRYEAGRLSYRDFIVEFANLWLTYRYGIMPLVYDIQGYVKALTEPRKPDRLTVRSTVRDEGHEHWVTTTSSSLIASITLDHDLVWTREYRATCMFEACDDLQSRLGLRLADVPSAVLELTRLSFVADWFFNIGEYLGSLTLGARASVVLQCVVERITAQYIAIYNESGTKQGASGAVSKCVHDGSATEVGFTAVRTVRQPYTTSDPGSLSPRLALSPKRILDGLSLLSTTMDISNRKTRLVRI